MQKTLSRISLLSVAAAAALFVTGCASVDDVKHAQATADQALSMAQAAQQTASSAQQTAQAAQQSADQARSDVNALSQRVDSLHHRKGERG